VRADGEAAGGEGGVAVGVERRGADLRAVREDGDGSAGDSSRGRGAHIDGEGDVLLINRGIRSAGNGDGDGVDGLGRAGDVDDLRRVGGIVSDGDVAGFEAQVGAGGGKLRADGAGGVHAHWRSGGAGGVVGAVRGVGVRRDAGDAERTVAVVFNVLLEHGRGLADADRRVTWHSEFDRSGGNLADALVERGRNKEIALAVDGEAERVINGSGGGGGSVAGVVQIPVPCHGGNIASAGARGVDLADALVLRVRDVEIAGRIKGKP